MNAECKCMNLSDGAPVNDIWNGLYELPLFNTSRHEKEIPNRDEIPSQNISNILRRSNRNTKIPERYVA